VVGVGRDIIVIGGPFFCCIVDGYCCCVVDTFFFTALFFAGLCYALLCQSYNFCVSRPGMVTLIVYRTSDVYCNVGTVAALCSSLSKAGRS
jgi:hypothetical protein